MEKNQITDKIKIGFIGNNIEEYTSLLKFIIYYKNTKKNIEKEMLVFNKSINNRRIIKINRRKFVKYKIPDISRKNFNDNFWSIK